MRCAQSAGVVATLLAGLVATQPLTTLRAQSAGAALHAVIEIGDTAPGARDNAVVAGLGDVPRIDAHGNVAVTAIVRSGTQPGRQAILRRIGDRVSVVVEEGDAAPGVDGIFTSFPGLPVTPLIDAGKLFITATAQSASEESPRMGLWSDVTGSLQPIVLQGQALPGMPSGAGLADWDVATRDQGRVLLLRGRFAEGASINPDSRGLWRHRNGQWQVLVVRGLSAPGVSGARFSGSPIGPYGPIFGYAADGAGRVIAQSWIAGRHIDASNDEGLWLETSAGYSVLARESERVASQGKVTFGPTNSSPTFGGTGENIAVSVNSAGAVLFGAVVRSSQGAVNSIWTTRRGVRERVLSGAPPLVGAGRGDMAPGLASGATFATFTFGVLNDADVIAFEGFADEFGDVFRLTEGIWWDAPGVLTLVLATGHAAPVVPGATVQDVFLETLGHENALLATARLAGAGIDFSNDDVLYQFRADGTAGVLLREGHEVDVMNAQGVTSRRRVATFRLGGGAAADGSRAIEVTFVDRSGGVYLLR